MTSNPSDLLQSRFVRGLEAKYERLAAAYRESGLGLDDAHRRALEEVKQFGREALEELRRRGLFPWAGNDTTAEVPDVPAQGSTPAANDGGGVREVTNVH
jgi:hypothetical protein